MSERPDDLLPRAVIAERIGYSERTVRTWVQQHPDELPTWPDEAQGNRTPLLLLSLSAVRVFCERHGKRLNSPASDGGALPGGDGGGSTMALQDGEIQGDTLEGHDGKRDIGVRSTMDNHGGARVEYHDGATLARVEAATGAVLDDLRTEIRAARTAEKAVRDELTAARQAQRELEKQLAEARMEAAVLRERVIGLEGRLKAAEQLREQEKKRHQEALFSEQTRNGERLVEQQTRHTEEVQRLVGELDSRRQEAAEMRQANERQQQREALLRWQAATSSQQRDVLAGALEDLKGASMWQRLTWRPPALELESTAPAEAGPERVVDVEPES